MSERLHDDSGGDPLGEQERGAGMAQVVEPLTGETGIGKDALEAPGDRDPVERRPMGRHEHEVEERIGWVGTEGQQLPRLAMSVGHERIAHEGRERHDPPARDGLGLDELQAAVDPRESMADRKGATLKIDVGPAQAKDLALRSSIPRATR